MGIIVAIDGPAGAGKSTTSREVAKILGFLYIDTGAMYRAVGLKLKELGLSLSDKGKIIDIAKNSKIDFKWENGELKVFLDNRDVTNDIRTNGIGRIASAVSVIPEVRDMLVAQQREYGKKYDIVMEGRDIGTNVFPGADVKIYMEASVEERAKRRMLDYKKIGKEISMEEVIEEIKERDHRDSSRSYAPLKKAKDAIVIDTTNMSFDEQVKKIVEIIKDRCLKGGE